MNYSEQLYMAWRSAHEIMSDKNPDEWTKKHQNFQLILNKLASRREIDSVLLDVLENFDDYSSGKEFVDNEDNPIDAPSVFQEDVACNLSVLHTPSPQNPNQSFYCTELFAIPICGIERSIRKILSTEDFKSFIIKSGIAPAHAKTTIFGLVPVHAATDIVLKPQLIHDTTLALHALHSRLPWSGLPDEKVNEIKNLLGVSEKPLPPSTKSIGSFIILGGFSFDTKEVKTFFNMSGLSDEQRESWETLYTDFVANSSVIDENDFCDIQFPCQIKEGVSIALSEYILINLFLQKSVGGAETELAKIFISVPEEGDELCFIEALNNRDEYIGSLSFRAFDVAPYLQDILNFWSEDPELSECEIVLSSDPSSVPSRQNRYH